jgi:hypothetical protein
MTGESRLDALARDLADGQVSRRTALRRFGAGLAATALPSFLIADEALARCPPSRKCGSKCCPSGQKCKGGKCKCKGGLKKCGRKCRDVSSDPANCGACDHACAPGETCVGGQCTGGGTQTATCGNGVAEGTEQCDGADLRGATCASLGLGSGPLACTANCTYDTSGCVQQPVCGNGVKESGELCDGTDLDGATCASLGFVSGTLSCASNCTYNTSGCVSPACTTAADCPQGPAGDCQKAVCTSGTCGFVADDGDVPADDGNQCTSDVCSGGVPSHPSKPVGTTCNQSGGTVCNGAGVCGTCVPGATQSCYTGPPGSLGVGICHGGTRTCQATGTFGACAGEVTPRAEICGNGQDDDCNGVIDNGCPVCGNGVKETGEQCDGGDLGGESCITLGFSGGTLACTGSCQFDTSACTGGCPGLGNPCTLGVGACERPGLIICDNGNSVCNATPGSPSPELCNGIDDNCNGVIDDGFDVGASCTCPGGASGVKQCSGDGSTTVCVC